MANVARVGHLFHLFLNSCFQGLSKGGKKGIKKKVVDPFTRKDWYDVRAPSIFKVREVGKTLVNRTQGTRIASDGLKGRVYEVSLADLQNETVRPLNKRAVWKLGIVDGILNCDLEYHGIEIVVSRDKATL